MFEHRLVQLVFDLLEQLMLAAGYAENDFRIPLDRVDQRVVGCGVAGVQRHHHVRVAAGIVSDITLEKLELVISEIRGDPIAKVDDIFLEIKPDNLDLTLLQDLEVIVDRESQIRLAAAEVDDAQRTVLRQSRKNIFDDLKIAVDLAEFRVGLRKNLSLRTHHAEANQKVAGHTVRNQIMLLAVVRERGRRGRADRSGKDARL